MLKLSKQAKVCLDNNNKVKNRSVMLCFNDYDDVNLRGNTLRASFSVDSEYDGT